VDRTVTVDWQGRSVAAADPEPVAAATFDLSTETVRRTEQAAAEIRATGAGRGSALDVVGRLLLRSEGLASSAIEGLRATAAEVAVIAAAGDDADDHAGASVAGWVADNLAVVEAALRERGPLTVERVRAWHAALMRHAVDIDPSHVGAWRDRLGWVGGANPLVAAHVAVPSAAIEGLMHDLCVFAQRDDVDAVTQAAVAHAQFETIHPFADGNGRIGRVLIGWILARRSGVAYPPPVSLEFARDVGGYQAGLTRFRQGDVDGWVRWFADAVWRAAQRSAAVLDAVAELEQRWATASKHLRLDSAARRLLPLLPVHPVVSAQTVASLLGVSEQAARVSLDALGRAGVLTLVEDAPRGVGRPRRWWVANEVLELVGR